MIIGRRMPRSAVLATACLLLLAAGCLHGEDGESNPNTVAVVLLDLSRSTYGAAGAAPRERYLSVFEKVLADVQKEGLLAVDVIDENSLAHGSLPVQEYFPKFNSLKDNRVEFAEKQRAQVRAVRRQVGDLLTRPPTASGSAILDALTLANDVFDTYSDARRKYLVIFSDMIEESTRYRLSEKNLAPRRVARFIAAEREAGRLPTLEGVEVYVAGAGVTAGTKPPQPERIRAIEAFWLQYFEAAGAVLPAERYGPTLVRFP